MSLSGETVRQCLAVQSGFFQFLAGVPKAADAPIGPSLFWEVRLNVGPEVVLVRCYNTAWLTQSPEQPGQLYFPLEAAAEVSIDGDVVLSAFHHPYNWLVPENANAFKRHIESHSDIVFTGHEHLPDSYVKEHGAESASTFVEAPPLYQDSPYGQRF